MKKRAILFMLRDILDKIITCFILAIIDIILYLSIAYILSTIGISLINIIFIKWLFIIIFTIYSIRLLVSIWLDYINYIKHFL